MMQRMRSNQDRALHEDLTEREQEVLLLMAKGMTNQQIADTLFIALKTVKTHVLAFSSVIKKQSYCAVVELVVLSHTIGFEFPSNVCNIR